MKKFTDIEKKKLKKQNGNSRKLMTAVVFDTNVLLSALIIEGKPRELWRKAKVHGFTLLLSKQILVEFANVASRENFSKYVSKRDIDLFLIALQRTAKFVSVTSRFRVVKGDSSDDVIVRTAYDGKADYIVSGDWHLLSLGEFKGIKIVSVEAMLSLLTM
jgi:putative PIN family toxin of toxin-antitoxin system